MRNITIENFETDVVEPSFEMPVLLHFYSPRMPEEQSLASVLETLAVNFEGRLIVAHVNVDEQRSLAQALKIRGIPTYLLMMDGKLVNGFTGVISEEEIASFLAQYLPNEEANIAHNEQDAAEVQRANGHLDEAKYTLESALARDPSNQEIRLDFVKLLMELHQFDAASQVVAPMLREIPVPAAFAALNDCIIAAQLAQAQPCDESVLRADIAANKRNFDARYALAIHCLTQGRYTEAMDELLEIIMRDRAWYQEMPRKVMVGILGLLMPKTLKPAQKKNTSIELIGAAKVNQQDERQQLIDTYRRRLSMMLN